MSNEETREALEFLIEQQAQFVARMGKDEARLSRLEESFVKLVELAVMASKRPGRSLKGGLDEKAGWAHALSRAAGNSSEPKIAPYS
jgi:hypothetical protein